MVILVFILLQLVLVRLNLRPQRRNPAFISVQQSRDGFFVITQCIALCLTGCVKGLQRLLGGFDILGQIVDGLKLVIDERGDVPLQLLLPAGIVGGAVLFDPVQDVLIVGCFQVSSRISCVVPDFSCQVHHSRPGLVAELGRGVSNLSSIPVSQPCKDIP